MELFSVFSPSPSADFRGKPFGKLLYCYIAVVLYYYTTILLHHYITVVLYYYTAILQYYYITIIPQLLSS